MAKWTTMAGQAAADDFQTPPDVCDYMCAMIPQGTQNILEPTPGQGNLVEAISRWMYRIDIGEFKIGQTFKRTLTVPNESFFDLDPSKRFDCIVMNPPFSDKSAFGLPDNFEKLGMRTGYYFLSECMKRSNNVIALMPWFTITDSDVRLRELYEFGLVSITALPRKTFQYARIQTCIFQLQAGYEGETTFKVYEFETKKR